MSKKLVVKLPKGYGSFIDNVFRIFKRKIKERCNVNIKDSGEGDVSIQFDISPGIGREGFCIESSSDREIRIIGNDERGLLYGVGRFLRTSQYTEEEFIPSDWRGTSVPQKEVRGIYFATHFHNFYHAAPIQKIERYLEDLSLWGLNTICVWFDMHHYTSINDNEAQKMIERLHRILRAAKRVGLKTSIICLANEAYANSPEEMRADWTGGHDGYKMDLMGHYHVELCPNKNGAQEVLLEWRKEVFEAFSDLQLDYICLWPYDQGGCTCTKCKPWGANGFLLVAEKVARLARTYFPNVKIILSTWYFDNFTEGEWEGLARAFKDRPDWVDYIMVGQAGKFPEYPLKYGVPGDFPLLGFAEVSMYGMVPWGGFGANPLPDYLQAMWDEAGSKLSGGFPYSEGIFEDINKVICSQFYWDEKKSANDSAREYIKYEYTPAPELVEKIFAAIKLLETSTIRNRIDEAGVIQDYPFLSKTPWVGVQRFVIKNTTGIDEAYRLIEEANGKLLDRVKSSWRWRILYLRSVIDYELFHNDFKVSERCEEAFRELTAIYYAKKGGYVVSPPTIQSINENRLD